MKTKMYSVLLVLCAIAVLLLAGFFFQQATPIPIEVPLLTEQMAGEHKAEQQEAVQKLKKAEAARKQADLQARVGLCETDDECIIVDQDPCGCLKGPDSVTAINSNYALEFSSLMSKRFAKTIEACPSVPSTERECSASARALCVEKHCKIVY